ncbi:hypothetical protein OTERR_05810 [Oryzomicrobium terrae]|uniref:N-acetyltransferase domain-containing protein n=1 Tax=Oryzomicrobium terrae TaxID=1735038 RepID=A0A5C1E6W7_9RHOO|nr:GNAT family N-acetyltransferase [Oryzomicrobium terrae]QEL64057.1 hypothetical protein OTERR_05810 [Oryzomicrobium terrae]
MSAAPLPGPLPLQIRTATLADLPALQALYRRCRAQADWLPAASRATADFATDSLGELVLVAHSLPSAARDGHVAGFVAVWEPDAFIHHLYVAPECRRQGVAGQLLAALAIRVAPPWRLKCLCANHGALAFYARANAREVGRGAGDDGPYVELELPPSAAALTRA